MRGGMGPLAGRAGASPWSDLPVSGRAEVSHALNSHYVVTRDVGHVFKL